MAFKKDIFKGLSSADQASIAKTLGDVLIWAETTFPPRYGYEVWLDEHGKEIKDRVIISGWLTRPWQQQVLDAPGLKKAIRVNRRGGKSMLALIKCLHTAFVKGRGVLVLTPYDKQAGELYKEIHTRFMDARPDIFTNKGEYPTIISDTKSPYVIRFSNGGFINFITTGAKTGGKADSVRGQGSNVGLMFLDEMDYMGKDELISIFAIAAQTRSMEILCTSTPTGKRETFWELCEKTPPDWKTFHYNVWNTLPNWDEQRDRAMKALLGHEGYVHEMLAEFGEESEGVFNKETLDHAIERGEYEGEFPYYLTDGSTVPIIYPMYGYAQSLPNDPHKKRIVGVDWDKYGAGTQILIIETTLALDEGGEVVDDAFDYIKVAHRREIVRSAFTLTEAVKALVEINKLFNPDYFYLDAGYGEHQIETLQTMGLECKDPEHPAYGIHNKIRRVNFSHGVKTIDPHTKLVENRPIKPEMVGRLRNKFDAEEIILNPYDNQLRVQLENYRVEKITASGQPKYVSVNEHIVDAFMLAVWGLYTEFGPNYNESPLIGFVDEPIGTRYNRRVQTINKELDRLGFRGKNPEKSEIEDDIQMAKQGFIKSETYLANKDSAVTAQSLFNADASDHFLQRNSRMPHTPRRRF